MDDLPPPIKISSPIHQPSDPNFSKDDDSLVDIKVKNPLQKFFSWIKSFLKANQNITIKIPIIGIFMALSSFGIGLGSGYNWGFNTAAATLFPNSSPILHRGISLEGMVQKSLSAQYYLKSGSDLWILKLTPPITPTILNDLTNKQVLIKGNLTGESLVIEVSEIIPLESVSLISPQTPNISNAPTSPVGGPNLPNLYPNLIWETTQKKVLIFTSGKRKIEQEGMYWESVQVANFPQDFINYYLEELNTAGFKETLNSINSEGMMVTYASEDLFLTFGIKNIYKGSGDKKQPSGYKAFIEHN